MKKIERKCRTGHVERISFTVYKIKLTFKGIAKIKKKEKSIVNLEHESDGIK